MRSAIFFLVAVAVISGGCADSSKSEKCEALLNSGKELYDKKKYEESIKVLLEAETYGSCSPKIYFYLGMSHLDIDKNEEAVKYFTKAIELEGDTVFYWDYGNRSMAYRRLGNREKAKEDIEMAIKLSPKCIGRLYRERAVWYLQGGEDRAAIEDYRKAAECEPDNMQNWVELYEALAMTRGYREVVDGRDAFVKKDPQREMLILYDLFDLISRAQLQMSTEEVEKELGELLSKEYRYTWYFNNFNRAIDSTVTDKAIKEKVMQYEELILKQMHSEEVKVFKKA